MKFIDIWHYLKLAKRIGAHKTPFISSMIFIHFLLSRIQIKLKLKKLIIPPPNMVISLTSRCNKTCSFCHYVDELNSNDYQKDELTEEQFKKILNYKSIPKYGRLCLYGGEPLLNNDFFRILKFANKKKYLTTIVTNGLLVKKYQDEMNNSGLSLVTLSYYKEDIDKIKTSIIELSKHIPINVSYVVSSSRLNELENMLIFAKEIKAEMVTIENLRENGKTEERTLFESEKLRDIQRNTNRKYSQNFIIRWSGFNQEPNSLSKIKCFDFWDTIFLNAKGEVSPCCQYPLHTYSGDISKMETSINSNEMIKLRGQILKNNEPELCKGCHYLYKTNPLYKS